MKAQVCTPSRSDSKNRDRSDRSYTAPFAVAMIAYATCVVLADAALAAEPTPPKKPGVIQLDETVISGNQELPKVLYIVPWQDPSGMPTIEISPEFSEAQVFRYLYPPAYRRELQYYDLLEGKKTEE